MRCTQCGKEMPDGARFCTNCGAQMNQNMYDQNTYNQNTYDQNPSEQSLSPIQKLKREWKDLYTVIAIVGVLLVAALIGLAVKKLNEPENPKELDEIQAILDEEEEEKEEPAEKEIKEEPEEEEIVEEEPEVQSLLEQDYILPNSNAAYLTQADLAGMTIQEINYAKNEIYARHGRRFKSQELTNYFTSKSWYQGTYDPDDFDAHYSASVLNDYEKKNAELLRQVEFSMNPNGYQLDQ